MKISNAFVLFGLASAKPSIMGGKLAETVSRKIRGDWVNQMMPARQRRADVDGMKGFKPLAAMILYMTGFDQDGKDPESHAQFSNKLQELEDVYTNYGCYCWINGVGNGVVGGGKTKDMSDHHCKELYRCYKCVNIDYAQNYTDVDYVVDFNTQNGQRNLDCTVNSKQDAENICECDKRFAANIAATQQSCKSGANDNEQFGAYCMDEQWRTTSGKVLDSGEAGPFNPSKMCDKRKMNHEKDHCCGIYPNRYPYDSNFKECCQEDIFDQNADKTLAFNLMRSGECEDAGGLVVVSEEGNPHSYVAVRPKDQE